MKKEQLSEVVKVRLRPAMLEQVKSEAAGRDLLPPDIIREALARYFKHRATKTA